VSGSLSFFLPRADADDVGLWAGTNRDPIKPEEITLLAAYAASTVTRTASRLTFKRCKRAMQTSDMLDDVGPAFEEVFGEEAEEEAGTERMKSKV
jgi:ATP-dependent NAD(P)H-hydrate dehydratase